MGCGASRPDSTHEGGVPPRLRPILQQRLDEMRAKRRAAMPKSIDNNDTGSTSHKSSATKQDESDPPSNTPRKLVYNQLPRLPRINKCNADDQEEVIPEISHVVEGENIVGNSEETVWGFVDAHECEKDERKLKRVCSPSFRVYCVTDSTENSTPAFHDTDEFEESNDVEEKVLDEDQNTNANEESVGSNEVSVKSVNKKGKRGRRLKQMMAKGGKHKFNILHHHHDRSSSENNARVLQRAVAINH